jgi:hypothetical protein
MFFICLIATLFSEIRSVAKLTAPYEPFPNNLLPIVDDVKHVRRKTVTGKDGTPTLRLKKQKLKPHVLFNVIADANLPTRKLWVRMCGTSLHTAIWKRHCLLLVTDYRPDE